MRSDLATAATEPATEGESLQLHTQKLGRALERELLPRAPQTRAVLALILVGTVEKLLFAEEAHRCVEAIHRSVSRRKELEREVEERVVRVGLVATRQAADLRFENAAEPGLQDRAAARDARGLGLLGERREILCQPVQRTAQELVRVLLSPQPESARDVGQRRRDVARRVGGRLRSARKCEVHQIFEAAAETKGFGQASPALGRVQPLLQISVDRRRVY